MNATNMSDIKMLEFDKIADPRGYTVIAEGGKEIPIYLGPRRRSSEDVMQTENRNLCSLMWLEAVR